MRLFQTDEYVVLLLHAFASGLVWAGFLMCFSFLLLERLVVWLAGWSRYTLHSRGCDRRTSFSFAYTHRVPVARLERCLAPNMERIRRDEMR
jgi:hypothetical protein